MLQMKLPPEQEEWTTNVLDYRLIPARQNSFGLSNTIVTIVVTIECHIVPQKATLYSKHYQSIAAKRDEKRKSVDFTVSGSTEKRLRT